MRLFVVLLAVFFATPVAAQEETCKIGGWPSEFEGRQPVGMPPGEGWKVVSGDGTLLTSDCLGVFTSPECVLDTIMACEAWTWVDDAIAADGSGYKINWHPICDTLGSRPGDVDSVVGTYGIGRDNLKNIVYYYKTVPFVLTEGNLPQRHAPPYPEGRSCRWCPGDVGVAYPAVICLPDPAIIGQTRDRWAIFDEFPDDSLISFCVEWNWTNALIVRKDEPTGMWRINMLYRAGSDYPEGWSFLKRFYQGMR